MRGSQLHRDKQGAERDRDSDTVTERQRSGDRDNCEREVGESREESARKGPSFRGRPRLQTHRQAGEERVSVLAEAFSFVKQTRLL